MKEPLFLVVDLFCGAGGTTTGFEMSDGYAKVIACVNHDPKAIKSHWLNHPDVKHFEEDIRTLDLTELTEIVKNWQLQFPDAYLVLWASLECTNFSKAKGGLPRDADSRTLADHLPRYRDAINPDYIMIENVVEFMSWGPLNEHGKPVSSKNGSDWIRWRRDICSNLYRDEWQEMNSANFGAYTSRNRLFGCIAKHGLPIVWPTPTHSKKPGKQLAQDLFGQNNAAKKWMPVKDVLDFSDEGESIFTRGKALSEKTLERIYAGLEKFVGNGESNFLAKYFSGRPEGKVHSTNEPAGTITTNDHHSIVTAQFLLKYNSTNGKTGKHIPPSIDEPAPVVSCQGRLGLVAPKFLQHYYGNGFNTGMDDPCPTLTTKERVALVQSEYFIDREFTNGGRGNPSSIEQPIGTIMPVPKANLVEAKKFIAPTNFNNQPFDLEQPMQTITANRKHHYLINPQYHNGGSSVEKPCFTLIARMDKRPPYLVQSEAGEFAIEVYETDSPMTIKIKQFMAHYGLADIKMRMLRVKELLKIQGFPEDYQMVGNQSDQKKFIGNSVHPLVVKHWVIAFANSFQAKTKAA